MKVAYVFRNNMASTYQLSTMILPQLEDNKHLVNVLGMFFFDDNLFCLQKGNPIGERLAKIAKEKGMLLMVCDQCAVRRGLADGTFEQCGSGKVMINDATVVVPDVNADNGVIHIIDTVLLP